MNVHARIKAGQPQWISLKFYDLFANFINAWKKSRFTSYYLGQGAKKPSVAAVYNAYWAFHEFLDVEAQRRMEQEQAQMNEEQDAQRRKEEEARKKEEEGRKKEGRKKGKAAGERKA